MSDACGSAATFPDRDLDDTTPRATPISSLVSAFHSCPELVACLFKDICFYTDDSIFRSDPHSRWGEILFITPFPLLWPALWSKTGNLLGAIPHPGQTFSCLC